MDNLLSIRNLSKRYGDFALDDVSLDVPAGSVVGLVGANGAGKTTTIKATLGLIRPDGGSISLFGEEVTGAPAHRVAELKQDLGVVFDACALPEEFTPAGIGSLMEAVYRNWDRTEYRAMLKRLELPADKPLKGFSRGMGMKLSLACALSHRPRLLVLDEATAGLDPLARDEALDFLRDYLAEEEGERGILMSSHITSDLEKIADYLVCIDAGRIAFSVETAAITDLAGVALCHLTDLAAIAACDLFAPGELRLARDACSTRVLVPDRFAFAARFPQIVVERADIDTYLHLTLKGETL